MNLRTQDSLERERGRDETDRTTYVRLEQSGAALREPKEEPHDHLRGEQDWIKWRDEGSVHRPRWRLDGCLPVPRASSGVAESTLLALRPARGNEQPQSCLCTPVLCLTRKNYRI